VVRLHDLQVVVCAELGRELTHDLAKKVDPDAHVRSDHYGSSTRRILDAGVMPSGETCGSDHVGLAVGEVLDGCRGGGELDQDPGVFGRLLGGGYADLSRSTQIAEVGS
jgi:hypothetical protein